MTGIKVLTPSILLLLACLAPGTVQAQTDWERDGLIGPVRRVRSEVALTLQSEGKMAEAPRALLSMEVYDQQGRKRGQTIYPARALENQQLEQSYHFNERGDISEATLKEAGGGRVVEERKYQYEYDPVGNWTKRIVAVSKTGRRISLRRLKSFTGWSFITSPVNSPERSVMSRSMSGGGRRILLRTEQQVSAARVRTDVPAGAPNKTAPQPLLFLSTRHPLPPPAMRERSPAGAKCARAHGGHGARGAPLACRSGGLPQYAERASRAFRDGSTG